MGIAELATLQKPGNRGRDKGGRKQHFAGGTNGERGQFGLLGKNQGVPQARDHAICEILRPFHGLVLNEHPVLAQRHKPGSSEDDHREGDQESPPEKTGAPLWFRIEHDSVDLPPTLANPRKAVVTGL